MVAGVATVLLLCGVWWSATELEHQIRLDDPLSELGAFLMTAVLGVFLVPTLLWVAWWVRRRAGVFWLAMAASALLGAVVLWVHLAP